MFPAHFVYAQASAAAAEEAERSARQAARLEY